MDSATSRISQKMLWTCGEKVGELVFNLREQMKTICAKRTFVLLCDKAVRVEMYFRFNNF
jgi:hypothetical protein